MRRGNRIVVARVQGRREAVGGRVLEAAVRGLAMGAEATSAPRGVRARARIKADV